MGTSWPMQRFARLLLLFLTGVAGYVVQTGRSMAQNEPRGKQMYARVGCYECHGFEGQGGSAGPQLIAQTLNLQEFTKYIRQPGGQMPPYTAKVLSDQDLADIYAFIKTLPKASQK